VILADQVGKDLRPVFEREGAMGHGFPKDRAMRPGGAACPATDGATRNQRARVISGTPEGLLTAATFRS